MQLRNKFFLKFIFLFALCFHDAFGADQNLFHHADSLFQAGAYREASLAFERVYFTHNEPILRAQANLGRARSLRALNEWQTALDVLARTRYPAIPQDLHYDIRAERVLLRYLNSQWRQVGNEIDQIRFFLPEEERVQDLEYLRLLAWHEMARWDEAYEIAVHLYDHLDDYDNLVLLYQATPELLRPERAGWLATFVPGAGQLYAGEWREGVASATLQVSALAWMGYNLWNGYYATGILTGGGVFQAVYFGSTERAQHLAERTNHNRKTRFNRELRELVLELEAQRRAKKKAVSETQPFEEFNTNSF